MTPQEAAVEGLAEVEALNALLAELSADDWGKATASAGWTVRDVVAHLAGQHVESARPWTIPGKLRRARRRFPGRTALEAHNALQLLEYGDRTPGELRALLVRFGPKAVRARKRAPGFIRRRSFARLFPEEHLPDLRFAYLFDVLSNRDTWLHRLEIARATGRTFTTGEHDRGIVAQVLRDLAGTWAGPSLTLTLTGANGGTWALGAGEPVAVVRAGALDYLWHLSGRDGRPAVDIDGEPAVAAAVLGARVEF
ncbi:maleylpyruvate isomerase family mycothiol-dependent enzyme [Amycolatopsis alkalitolerans]|uniref:Maleylpyruvate isomerase family mycothiol-dependent enzyme n=1 Tax=Amycolatopsis alkalitolerans TaxID=2547244 RepID=A0A5C4M1X2_9PSEU|nr:maleylpyruvate isomerase family mycothiol-dependent enzyme [Amycolatopsis alkalitolerans]TNC24633.1 maleylpyruvate isomerase family mycothiol-dependent enzyme [Amycolatopsis alkalitolerans]